mmetsp:Transcript_17084/g.29622  ORF Transcript_17084/g.29622 Transcript_17084/m.29622 type:complete len:209 (+) Transcript_17084:257-883(+)
MPPPRPTTTKPCAQPPSTPCSLPCRTTLTNATRCCGCPRTCGTLATQRRHRRPRAPSRLKWCTACRRRTALPTAAARRSRPVATPLHATSCVNGVRHTTASPYTLPCTCCCCRRPVPRPWRTAIDRPILCVPVARTAAMNRVLLWIYAPITAVIHCPRQLHRAIFNILIFLLNNKNVINNTVICHRKIQVEAHCLNHRQAKDVAKQEI